MTILRELRTLRTMWVLRMWHRRVWWKRFTRGECVDCGVRPSLQGAPLCRFCFERKYPYLTGRKP